MAFDGCTLPGADAPLFTVPAGHMSLGLGIHGEPGISDHPMPTASELAELLVSRLLADKPDDAGTRVVAIVNGLGTVKYDELFLLFGKIEKLLTAAGLTVVEPECGELVTSLDMSGLSLTLLWLDEELEQYWAAPADTPAFRKGNLAPRARRELAGPEAAETADAERPTAAAAALGRLAADLLAQVRDVVVEHEEELGSLDAIAGDGDHGIGMRRGVDAAVAAAEQAAADDGGASRRTGPDRGRGGLERTRRRNLRGALGLGGHRRRPGPGQPGSATAARTRPPRSRPSWTPSPSSARPNRGTRPWWTPSCRSGTPSSTAFDGGASVAGALAAAAAAATRPPRTDRRTCVRSRAGPARSPKRASATPTPVRCPSH